MFCPHITYANAKKKIELPNQMPNWHVLLSHEKVLPKISEKQSSFQAGFCGF